MKLTKRQKYFIGIITLILFAFTVYKVTFWRINAVETALKEEMLNKLLDLVDAVDYSRFSVIGAKDYDSENPKYLRLQKQLHDYQEHFPELRVSCIVMKDNTPILRLSSDTTQTNNLFGQEYQFNKALIKSIFESQQSAVVENINDKGEKYFSAFVPLIDYYNSEVMMVVGMDFSADNYSQKAHEIGSSSVLTVLIFVFLIVITFYLVYRRNRKSVEIRKKYRHIETIATFIIALIFTSAAVLISNEYIRQSEKLSFQYNASIMANSIRAKFLEIRNNLNQLNSFFVNSEDVSASEFSSFSNIFLNDGSVKSYSYFEVSSKSKEVEGQTKISLSTADSSQIVLKFSHFANDNNNYYELIKHNEAISEAASKAFKSGLITTSQPIKLHFNGREDHIFVLFMPVFKNSEANNKTNSEFKKPIGFLSAILVPQISLEVALKKYQWAIQKLAISMFDIDKEANEWVASYPFEHYNQLKKSNNINEHIHLYSDYIEMPLFAFGHTFTLVAHPDPGGNLSVVYIRSWMIGIGGILISIFLLLMVRQSRNKWSVLENEVNQRTTSLNRRIRDLDCQRMLSEKIQSATHADAWKEEVLILLRNVFLPNEGYSLSLECYDNKLESELFDLPKKKKIEAEIRVGNENIGRIVVFSSSNDLFVPEDQQLINQVALILGNWIERQNILAALKTSEEKFRNLIENAFDAIYLMEDRHYSYVNSGFVKLVDYSFEELTAIDFNFSALLTEKSKKIGEERFAARQQGLEVASTYETQLLTKNKQIKDVEISTVSVGDGGNVLIMGIIRDITERKNIQRALLESEELLQQQNEELQVINEELTVSSTQVREMNLELVQAKEKAEASDNLKTAFLNNISHEVRTPLNGIMGASLLMSDISCTLKDRQEMAEIIQESSNRLIRTITQYMDISMLNSESMPVYNSQTDIKQFIVPIFNEFAAACEKKNISFDIIWPEQDVDLSVNTDRSLLEKVLQHLLENAVKFTSKGSINLSIEIIGQYIEFGINDTGIGMDKNFHPRVFEHFMQEDFSNLRQFDGSGLGLAICDKICKLLGGKIWFESEKGVGSTFYVKLPINQEQNKINPILKMSEIVEKVDEPVILIAEDEDSNFMVLSLLLKKKLNAKIIRAVNGKQAVELCGERDDFRVVLMDIKMPIMDGFEATKLIKEFRPKLPIIAITAYGLSGDEHRALEAGCNDYLAKPIQTSLLFEKLSKWMAEGSIV